MNAGTGKPTLGGHKGPRGASALAKVAAAKACDVTKLYEPGEPALAELTPEQSPAEFLEHLRGAALEHEAINFLSYALPRRELLYWGALCIREGGLGEAGSSPPNPKVAEALAAVDHFVEAPDDARRRAAMVAAEAATFETPAGCLALGVFLSEGSMAPPDCPPVPVGEGFCAKTVAAAIILCTLAEGVADPVALARRFVELGVETANMPAPWESNS